ncbi:MAG TPA: alpha-L-arabinofuranosidase [Candidatus Didemnitutus sp.]|nr:alpha-L-arabinofuranosidase [Candidatus Didemnitutus sp.]
MKNACLFRSVLFALTLGLCASASAQSDLTIYSDSLAAGWSSWSWATVDFASTAYAHTGSTSIAVSASPWSALSLQHDPFDSTGYGNVTFWINGGAVGGQTVRVFGTLDHNGLSSGVGVGPLAANTWQQVTVPLASLGADNKANFTGIWIQEFTGTDESSNPFYVDDVVLTGSVPVTPPPPLDGAMAIYEDSFVNGWQDWSWATVNSGNVNPVNSGSASIAVTSAPYTALRFHHDAIDSTDYTALTFWINGGTAGGQMLQVNGLLSGTAQPGVPLGPLVANTWTKVSIPLSALGVAAKPDLTDFWLQEIAGVNAPTYYVDDIRLELAPPPSVVNVTINAKDRIREVDPRLFGLNTAIWDGSFDTPTTQGLLTEACNQALRFPGGSASDQYHWQTNMSEGQTFTWATNFDAFADIAEKTHAQVYITANYGTGTPEEAAAWVKYSNKTKHHNFQYWEIGNENYGTWEADSNTRPNDPVTYVTRFKEYVRQMKAADHSIKIGAVIVADEDSDANYSDESATNPRTSAVHHGWSAVMLATFKQMGVTPDFVIYHRYEQAPGGENDAFLLNSARTWNNDATSIRQMLTDYLGKAARNVEIDCTENNSVYSNPGKQTTSLVNGLFLADSLGNLMKTEFNSFFWWDLRNGQEAGNNNAVSLYGWRNYGDYGIVDANTPAGPADRYPTFYVYKLLKYFARGGERVVSATSDYNGLGVYVVRDHHTHQLNVLLINKHPTTALNVNITVNGFKVGTQAITYSYGIPQDDAARTGTGSADIASGSAAITGANFSWAPAPYSATVLQLTHPRDSKGHDNQGDCDDDND